MSIINRYKITRRMYPDYVILISKNKSYHVFGDDDTILKYIKFKGRLSKLNKLRINYLVLDNLDIIDIRTFDDNNYRRYYILGRIDNVFRKLILESFDA